MSTIARASHIAWRGTFVVNFERLRNGMHVTQNVHSWVDVQHVCILVALTVFEHICSPVCHWGFMFEACNDSWWVVVCASSFCVVLVLVLCCAFCLCCACQPDLYIYKLMAHIVVFWWWLFLMRTQVVCWMICMCCLGPPSKRSWEYLWEGILTSLSETYGWELYTS